MTSSNSAIFVIGPAGVGKTTFCSSLVEYCMTIKRPVHFINLDPAAENFINLQPLKDIKDCLALQEVMQETGLGPNGGLIYCLETLVDNLQTWLDDDLVDSENDYFVVDCPGQIELFTHYNFLSDICRAFQNATYNICFVYCLESSFLADDYKFLSGVLNSITSMLKFSVPHINVITKIDLLDKEDYDDGAYDKYFHVDTIQLASGLTGRPSSKKFTQLNQALLNMIDEYSLVRFLPLSSFDENSIAEIVLHIDHAIQYGESQEPREMPQSHAAEE